MAVPSPGSGYSAGCRRRSPVKGPARAAKATTPWDGYIEMALEPEVRCIVLRDGPAVLSGPAEWPTANGCITAMTRSLASLAAAIWKRR